MTCSIIGCADPGCQGGQRRRRRAGGLDRFAKLRRPVARTCRNCRAGRHGRWCCASLFGPFCPCRCRVVLGLDGPFPFGDPTAPGSADAEVA